ncbi:MAG: sigma 54-interacting transcriptional regulator, partial [Chloroflexota bacterium]
MKTGQVTPIQGVDPDPIVVRSWQRCAPRSDPRQRPRQVSLQAPSFQATLKAHADVMMLARPFLEDIYQFMEGSYCAIVFTDGAGCILDMQGDQAASIERLSATTTRARMVGDDPGIGGLQAFGLQPGSMWAEGNVGTNAIGLTLITAMPIQVVGAEHYFEVYHHLVTSAAPIHDVSGRIVGTIGLVEPVTAATRHTLSLVMSAARAISNQLQANLYLEEANHRLAEVNIILESINEGIVVWDEGGRLHHLNKQAGNILHLNPAAVMGKLISDILTPPAILAEAIEVRKELRDAEISFRVGDEPIRLSVSLRFVSTGEGRPLAYLVTIRPIERIRQLVHQQVGSQASLALEDISSYSAAMRPVLRQARTAARGTAPVLLRGEGGVGKNHLARAIHNDGSRASRPFMAINCRAVPHELMVSEFLGHEEDAVHNGRPSKFELTNGGTLLLDQVEGLSLEMQAALLHVIETKHVMRLGGTHPIPVDVRIIAATAADLEQLVAEGNVIAHLYYRFGVFNIAIPPLRERVDDIPILAERFLARITDRNNQPVWIDDEAMKTLRRYP